MFDATTDGEKTEEMTVNDAGRSRDPLVQLSCDSQNASESGSFVLVLNSRELVDLHVYLSRARSGQLVAVNDRVRALLINCAAKFSKIEGMLGIIKRLTKTAKVEAYLRDQEEKIDSLRNGCSQLELDGSRASDDDVVELDSGRNVRPRWVPKMPRLNGGRNRMTRGRTYR
jgi:hypothetical protein